VRSQQLRVVHEGVAPRFRPVVDPGTLADLRQRCRLGSRPYLLAVGTVQPRKNLLGLLRAHRILLDAIGGEVQLVLAGRPAWGKGAVERELRRLGLAPHVRLLGYITDDDLAALYSGALAYVQPSLYEGFGLTVLEAMACGVPVVASNTSSLPEVVGGAGLLVDPNDPHDIASAVGRLIDKPHLRAELSAAGRRRAAEFSWDHCARETLTVLTEAAGSPPSSFS
jgi:glycosyltransferase involved in cell wall biosynthesis